jgi:hypothetical protein
MSDDDDWFERTVWGDEVERPFDAATITPGRFDMRVLDQDTEWVDGQGHRHRLTDLDPVWRRNIGAFLYLRARSMHRIEAACDALGLVVSAAEFWATVASGVPAVAVTDPYDWLESTTLFRALRRLQPDLATAAELRRWAEAAHAILARDPDAVVTLPQDPNRLWNS